MTETTTLVRLETIVMHKSGEWLSSTCEMPVTKQDPQGHVAAYTYLRRATLCAVIGIAPEDDDGNTASAGTSKAPASRNPAPPSSPDEETRVTKLKTAYRNICMELGECADESAIDGLLEGYAKTLGEVQTYVPSWYAPSSPDTPSWDERVAAQRAKVRKTTA